MFKVKTVPQLMLWIQVLTVVIFFCFLITGHFSGWLYLFPVIMIGLRIFTIYYHWKTTGDVKPAKDLIMGYFIMVVTLLVLVLFFNKR